MQKTANSVFAKATTRQAAFAEAAARQERSASCMGEGETRKADGRWKTGAWKAPALLKRLCSFFIGGTLAKIIQEEKLTVSISLEVVDGERNRIEKMGKKGLKMTGFNASAERGTRKVSVKMAVDTGVFEGKGQKGREGRKSDDGKCETVSLC